MFFRYILLSSLHEYSMALSSDPTVPPQSYGFAVKISHQTCCRFRESQTKLLRLNTQECAVRLIIYSSRQWRSEALASGALIGRVGSHGLRAQAQGIRQQRCWRGAEVNRAGHLCFLKHYSTATPPSVHTHTHTHCRGSDRGGLALLNAIYNSNRSVCKWFEQFSLFIQIAYIYIYISLQICSSVIITSFIRDTGSYLHHHHLHHLHFFI